MGKPKLCLGCGRQLTYRDVNHCAWQLCQVCFDRDIDHLAEMVEKGNRRKIMNRTAKIQRMIQDITDNSEVHGFWDNRREPPETISLIHSEISEALEEYRARPDDLLTVRYRDTDGKPEGFGVELADTAIRVMDWMGHDGMRLSPVSVEDRMLTGYVPRDLAVLHLEASKVLEEQLAGYDMIVRPRLCRVLWLTARIAKMHKINLWDLIEEKHKFNVGRPYKHGKAC